MKPRDPDHGGTIGVTNNKSKESSALMSTVFEDSFTRAKSGDNLTAEVNYFEDASKTLTTNIPSMKIFAKVSKALSDSDKVDMIEVISKSEVLGSSKPPGRPASPSTRGLSISPSGKRRRCFTRLLKHRWHKMCRYLQVLLSLAMRCAQSASAVREQDYGFRLLKKVKRTNQSGSHRLSKVTYSSSMHPPNTVKSTLSGEELAILLHQELNSSPRVPRVPRVMRHGGSIPRLASPMTTNMLIKKHMRLVKNQILVSKRKSKEGAPKDGSRNSQEFIHDAKKMDKETLGGSYEVGHSAKKCTFTSTLPLSVNPLNLAIENQSPSRNSPKDTSQEDDDSYGGITGPPTFAHFARPT
ncbi:hypothetical protein IFM89_039399 [Coptis chinensis]|uniref:Uncharacterized protein n=1 Tax=Coptis chinensis TaxID=261450 RepID=A0A835IAN9_9MAGN|nr:hypothetical protein IFM89_039399 [Coptis chinensis]